MFKPKPRKPVILAFASELFSSFVRIASYVFKRFLSLKDVFLFTFKHFSALKGTIVVTLISIGLALVFATTFLFTTTPSTAYATPPDTLNFQARLMTASGSIVPDGDYNVQFKLYTALTGGSLLWTENDTYANGSANCDGPNGSGDCRIHVVNGYLSVDLGNATAFGSINWDQNLYLTMNIGGTNGSGTITYDGEMSPRLQLTGVPYAFQSQSAESLTELQGSATDSLQFASGDTTYDNTITLPDLGGLASANESFGLLALQNGTNLQQTGNFNISGTGVAGSLQVSTSGSIDTSNSGTLSIGSANATQIDLNQSTVVASGKTLTVGTLYGSSASGGTLTIDSTSNGTKGSVIIQPTAGSVGVGTTTLASGAKVTVSGAIQQTGLGTLSTSSTYTHDYTELGSCSLTTQYSGCSTQITIVGGENGAASFNSQASVFFTVYQQAAMASAPVVGVNVQSNAELIKASDLTAVITTNTSGQTVVQLWAQINLSYSSWNYTPLLVRDTGTGVMAWTPDTAFQASLPAGTATTGTFNDVNANTITLQNSSATAVQIQNASGYSELKVDTSGNKVTLGNVTATSGQGITGTLVFADGTNDNYGLTLRTTTSNLTANRTIYLPDEGGTICLQGSSSCGFITGSGSAFLQNGNNFGGNAVLGTTGAGQTLAFETAGTSRAILDASGNLQFQQASTLSTSTGQLTITGGTTLTLQSTGANAVSLDSGSTGAVNIGTGANAKTITIGNTSVVTNLTQNVGGTFTLTGATGSNFTIASGTTTGTITIGSSLTSGTITIGGTGQTGALKLQASGITQTVTGSGSAPSDVVKTTTNSASAFQVQSSGGTVLDVDTSNDRVGIDKTPGYALDINGSAAATQLVYNGTNGVYNTTQGSAAGALLDPLLLNNPNVIALHTVVGGSTQYWDGSAWTAWSDSIAQGLLTTSTERAGSTIDYTHQQFRFTVSGMAWSCTDAINIIRDYTANDATGTITIETSPDDSTWTTQISAINFGNKEQSWIGKGICVGDGYWRITLDYPNLTTGQSFTLRQLGVFSTRGGISGNDDEISATDYNGTWFNTHLAVGYTSGQSSTLAVNGTGYFSGDVGIGTTAGYSLDVNGDINASGVYRIGGDTMLQEVTTGNVFVGGAGNDSAIVANGGVDNIAMGDSALVDDTSGSYNFALGGSALFANTTGNGNVAVGINALEDNAGGLANVGIGQGAGAYLASSNNGNVLIGYYAAGATSLTSGSNATILGDNSLTLTSLTTFDNSIVIGEGDFTPATGGPADLTGDIIIGTGLGANITGVGTNFLDIGSVLYGNTSTGAAYLKSTSTAAFQVQNASGSTTIFNVDTNDNAITVGSGSTAITLYGTVTSGDISAFNPSSPGTAETWHYVGQSGQPAFGTGWSNRGGAWVPLAFRKLASPADSVEIRGWCDVSATSHTTLFTLPTGYRPTDTQTLLAWSVTGDAADQFNIGSNGVVSDASSTTIATGNYYFYVVISLDQ
jgi:hypothetical protein